jgi:hypothetical protein
MNDDRHQQFRRGGRYCATGKAGNHANLANIEYQPRRHYRDCRGMWHGDRRRVVEVRELHRRAEGPDLATMRMPKRQRELDRER